MIDGKYRILLAIDLWNDNYYINEIKNLKEKKEKIKLQIENKGLSGKMGIDSYGFQVEAGTEMLYGYTQMDYVAQYIHKIFLHLDWKVMSNRYTKFCFNEDIDDATSSDRSSKNPTNNANERSWLQQQQHHTEL